MQTTTKCHDNLLTSVKTSPDDAFGGPLVNAQLGALCVQAGDPAQREQALTALFRHPSVRRKIALAVNRQLRTRRLELHGWARDELHSIANMQFISAVDAFDPTRHGASFLGLLDVWLRSIGSLFACQRTNLSIGAFAYRSKNGKLTDEDYLVLSATDELPRMTDCDRCDLGFDAGVALADVQDPHGFVCLVIDQAGLTEAERELIDAQFALVDRGIDPTDERLAIALATSSSTAGRRRAAAYTKLRAVRSGARSAL